MTNTRQGVGNPATPRTRRASVGRMVMTPTSRTASAMHQVTPVTSRQRALVRMAVGSGLGRVERRTAQPERGAIGFGGRKGEAVAGEGAPVGAIGANHGRGGRAGVRGSALVVAALVAVIVVVAGLGGAGLMVPATGAASGCWLIMMPMAQGRADERLDLDKQHGEQHQIPRHWRNVSEGTERRNRAARVGSGSL